MLFPEGVQIAREHPELGHVIRSVGKVHVTEEQHLVCCLVTCVDQGEIPSLWHVGLLGQKRVELRQNAICRSLITARNGDEDIAVLLGGLHLIDTLVIRDDNLDTVGENDITQRLALAGDYPIDSRTVLRLQIPRIDGDVGRSDMLDGTAAADSYLIGS